MAIVSYNGLREAVQGWLWREDDAEIEAQIPVFIQMAEKALRRDPRVRRQRTTTLEVDSEEVELPDDFVAIESLYHDGPVHFGELEIVSPGDFGDAARRYSSGPPRVAAVIDQNRLLLAPAPDDTYELRLSWWQTVPHLGSGVLSNWLLERAPDVYLYATLVESAPYLRDDARVQLWRMEMQDRLEQMHKNTERGQYSGKLTRRPANPII